MANYDGCRLAYLHEAIEPKVVHRDIKSSNILIDDEFNGKVSDFGLAKLLGSDKSHITTRVMGTFGYSFFPFHQYLLIISSVSSQLLMEFNLPLTCVASDMLHQNMLILGC